MKSLLVLALLALVLVYAFKGSRQHFQGQGGCCGGGAQVKAKREWKFLRHRPIGKCQIKIAGMHCQNCVTHVTNALNELDGVAARVNLRSGTATVYYDRPVSDDELKQAVLGAGYQVEAIRRKAAEKA